MDEFVRRPLSMTAVLDPELGDMATLASFSRDRDGDCRVLLFDPTHMGLAELTLKEVACLNHMAEEFAMECSR